MTWEQMAGERDGNYVELCVAGVKKKIKIMEKMIRDDWSGNIQERVLPGACIGLGRELDNY